MRRLRVSKWWTRVVLLGAYLLSPSEIVGQSDDDDDDGIDPSLPLLGLREFTSILSTEVGNEFEYDPYGDGRSNRRASRYWEAAASFEWGRAGHDDADRGVGAPPVLVCDETPDASGNQRRRALMSALASGGGDDDEYDDGVVAPSAVVSNRGDASCFVSRSRAAAWRSVDDGDASGHVRIVPMTYAARMARGSVDTVTNRQTFVNPVFDVTLCPGVLPTWTAGFSRARARERLETDWREYLTAEGLAGRMRADLFWTNHDEGATTAAAAAWTRVIDRLSEGRCGGPYEGVTLSFDAAFDADAGAEGDASVALEVAFAAGEGVVDKTCARALLLVLATRPEACSVSARPALRTFNRRASWIVQSGAENDEPFSDAGLDGRGQIVAVSDTGLDVDNCYFRDDSRAGRAFTKDGRFDGRQRKVVSYDPALGDDADVEYGHGTHVCGTIAGRRSDDGVQEEEDGAADGVAPRARLAFVDVAGSDGALRLPRLDRLLSTGRPRAAVHCAAWGTDGDDGYGALARQLDTFVHRTDQSDLLVVVAAGAGGRRVADPATAKNALAVGASNSAGPDQTDDQRGPEFLARDSGRGPAEDGRTRPDVVAPGSWILSAGARPDVVGECDGAAVVDVDAEDRRAGEGLLYAEGTSPAAATAAGAAALVRQYLQEGWFPLGTPDGRNSVDPTAALVKALLLNGARYLAGVDAPGGVKRLVPYDNAQNFGRIALHRSLRLKRRRDDTVRLALWDRQILDDGGARTYEIPLNYDECDSVDPDVLSVTLVWADPPAVVGCLRCLLNDLDLSLTTNLDDHRRAHRPNDLPGRDSTNNAERIRLERAPRGDDLPSLVRVTVEATNLSTNRQSYALVATGCFDPRDLNLDRQYYWGEDDGGGSDGVTAPLTARRSAALFVGAALVVSGVLCVCYALLSNRR